MSEKDPNIGNPEGQEEKSIPSIKKMLLNVRTLGILAGALGGYIYYLEIGCKQGTCPITSNPYITVLWGAVLGYLIADMFRPKRKA